MALVLAIATAATIAASLRLPSLVSTLLAGYLALVADLALVTWALSAPRWVTPTGLAIAEAVLLAAALAVWWRLGRPLPPLAGAAATARRLAGDPATALFLAVAALALLYELVVGLTMPPNNWDSLTYHLPRVAAWAQHDGIHWIANAPTDRMNEFQPLAEQEILFLFVATGSTATYALPQLAAELAILLAVYGSARRLGFGERPAAGAAALLGTLNLVALEATTAQNDLVAASLPAAAACLLLAAAPVEAVLAGVALGLGVGAKLTTALAWPVLAWLAWVTGRGRALGRAAAGAALGLLLAGAWSYVLNLANTGHVLGHGQGRVEATASPSVVGTARTAVHVLYRVFDRSVLEDWLVAALAAAGAALALAGLAFARRRGAGRRGALVAAALAGPFVAPALVIGAGSLYGVVARAVRLPVTGPGYFGGLNAAANEDHSAFGPLGTVALLGAPLLAAGLYAAGRADVRRLALAAAFPSYVLLLALVADYNVWLTRFLIVPLALTAPLFAYAFGGRAVTATTAVVAGICVGLTLAQNQAKPLDGERGRPWQLSQADALAESPAQDTGRAVAGALEAYERRVPEGACVGAVLDPDEPSYVLFGPGLVRRVVFLPSLDAVATAARERLGYVVVSKGVNAPVAGRFATSGFAVEPLGSYWQLAVRPGAGAGSCPAS